MQRYLTIVKSDHFKVTSFTSAFLIIAGIWIYTMFIALPPFFGYGVYVPESSGLTCAPDWESNKHIYFTIYWLCTGFLIPLTVILYTSYKTVLHLKEVSFACLSHFSKIHIFCPKNSIFAPKLKDILAYFILKSIK